MRSTVAMAVVCAALCACGSVVDGTPGSMPTSQVGGDPSSQASPPPGDGDATTTDHDPQTDTDPSKTDSDPPPANVDCVHDVWNNLDACGWPSASTTGPDMSACPNGLAAMGGAEVSADNTVIACKRIQGQLHITARGVVVRNSYIEYDSGKRGTDANGTAPISIDDGASATISHVEINGLDGVHACIWNQGTPSGAERSMIAEYVNCYNVDDGIFNWADTGYSSTTGDGFVIRESYFHDLTDLTSNGHMDGFQTEGSKDGLIEHNTYAVTTDTDSCIAIWNSLKDSADITIQNNLMMGGGAAVYAEDYDPSESSPQGGNETTNIQVKNNVFSTHESECVGAYFVWYARPAYAYGGGPTDGWHRSGNYVLETNESVDDGNPHVNGQLCN
jgi:hypothetical protein